MLSLAGWAVSVALATAPLCSVDAPRNSCATQPMAVRVDVSGGPSAVDPLGRGTWLVDEENDEVLLVTPFGSSRRFPVGRWPQQVLVESSGRVFVSCREAGRIEILDTEFRRTSVEVGEEPGPLTLDELGHKLYVGLITARAVVALDSRTLLPAARLELDHSPKALALTAGGLAVASDRSPTVLFLDRTTLGERSRVTLQESGGVMMSTQLLVPANDGVLVIAESAQTGLEQEVSAGGYGGGWFSPFSTHVFAIPDLDRGYAPAVALATHATPLPTQAAFANGRLFVASRGNASVLAMGVTADLRATSPLRELRLNIQARPDLVGLAVGDRGELLLADALGRRLIRAELPPEVQRVVAQRTIEPAARFAFIRGLGTSRGMFMNPMSFMTGVSTPLPEGKRDLALRIGAQLFHASDDFRISGRGMACASCHPDGREDGRVWQLTGTRRQTPMLSGRLHDTAPFNWLGAAKTMKANLRTTIVERLEGEGLDGRDLDALSRFLTEGIRPVHAPAPKEPELVALGNEVFNDAKVGCGGCHPSDLALTDGAVHDVDSVSPREQLEFRQALRSMEEQSGERPPMRRVPRKFDTPSLRFVALTAPYFHDGAAQSLEQLVLENRDRMGTTSQLSDLQRRALVAYLQTL